MVQCVSILGSTGSIGRQSLDIIRRLPGIRVAALTAGTNVERMAQQCREFSPKLAVMATQEAAQALAASFAAHQTRKEYLALVRGWLPGALEVDHALKPDDAPDDAPVQEAHTTLRCLSHLSWPESYDGRHAETRISLVQALPTTGRRHQIRRHLKHVAHPIIGDATHGKGPLNRWWATRLGQQRLWLHAWQLALPHPVTGEWLELDSGLLQPGTATADIGDWHRLLEQQPWALPLLRPTAA